MNKKIVAIGCSMIFFVVLFLSLHMLPVRAAQQLLVVVLMVKNEAHVICPTLQPFVDAGVDSFFIFDTGSTDGTPEIVANYFKKNGIKHGYVAQEPFVDFATSRNRALELAEQQFPQAIFMVMPDAEWYLQNADQLVKFCEQHVHDAHGAYFVRLHMISHDFFLQRLLRCDSHARFIGAVHERLNIETAPKVSDEVFFNVQPSERGQEATKKRLLRDLDILRKEHEGHPGDTRAMFFLGQTYEGLNRFEEAYRYYRLCVNTQLKYKDTEHWRQSQAYEASYVSATLVEEIAKTNKAYSWRQAFNHYLEAFSIWPGRAEPLVCIAKYYWREKNMPLCFLFARRAADLPFPEQSVELVDRELYDFQRYDLLGACAGNLGKLDVSEWAIRKALQAQPHHENLRRSLALIEKRRQNGAQ